MLRDQCKRIFFFLLMVLMPQIAGAEMKLLDWLFFSDKAYVKHMEVQAYIVPKEDICELLLNFPERYQQLDNKSLYNKDTFLLLRVRNNGKKHAWGALACKVPTYHSPIKLSIYGVGRSNARAYNVYLIQLGSLIIVPGEIGIPAISIEWDELYTK